MRKAGMVGKVAQAHEYTLAQAVLDLTPRWERQKDWSNKRRYIRELVRYFGGMSALTDISAARVQDYIGWALQQPVTFWIGGPETAEDAERPRFKQLDRARSPGTVNQYLNVLRQIIERGTQVRDPMTGEPAVRDKPKVPVLRTLKRRARPVPDDVLRRVDEIVRAHVQEALRLTLYFGFRQSEIFGLQRGHVDLGAGGVYLEADGVKDRKDAFLHGSPDAMALLGELVDQARERNTDYLVTVWREGRWQPIKSPKTAWKTAMKTIIAEFGKRWRWHDIRAAYITHVAITSGAIPAQKMARHKEFKTTQGYIDVADELLREAANKAALRPALTNVLPLKRTG